ncbi:hypothetical protein HU200_062890 [Digitaria exilis]|uniref:Exportin-5 C-terminal domain-containing protein n=1 Tax=Digitaria exilis TaxID=1010633 RepID=A0A835A6S6_9POAL|nr:hypothetical protein HU200_062890 [Digitaria exilis]
MLWREPIITYDLSGVTAKDIKFILENGKLPDNDEAELQQNAKTWLLDFRETGYNVIRLCASVKGAFYGLLDESSIINVLTENLRSMEFNHLIQLIQLVFIPLVEYCPRDSWDEWIVRAKVPAYLGNPRGPEEIVNEYEKELLLKFTRSVSNLLKVLALERLNTGLETSTTADVQDSKSISSNSIIGYRNIRYLLLHNCFGRLSMYLFGCLADYEVAENALPFCCYLIHIARATNHERLNQFILNEMLPTAILLLGDDVKSAISQLSCSLNSTTKEDARNNVTRLCLEIYRVYLKNQASLQVTSDEGVSDCFKDWLAKELECLSMRASCAVPEDFPKDVVWNWEFNEEFERYLRTYMKMLEEVDAMDDCLEPYLFHLQRTDSWDSVFKRLQEAHKDLLKTIACQLALADKSVLFEPLEPQPNDFMEHLWPYARMYIERKKKEFGDTFQFAVPDLVKSQFSALEDDLIAMSFEVLFTWTFDFSC